MKDDRLYLIHVLESVERIESFIREGRDAFHATPVIQDAVIRNCEIIGEAAKRISDALRHDHPVSCTSPLVDPRRQPAEGS